MNEPVDNVDLELQELRSAVAEVGALMAERWFREMLVCDLSDRLDQLADLLEQAGLNA